MRSPFPAPLQVLVVGGETRPALAIARSLARRGIPLLVAGKEREMAMVSRHVAHARICPSPTEDPPAFLRFVIEAVDRHGIRLIIPVSDSMLVVFDRHRQELEEHAKLAMAGSAALQNVLNKRENLRLARQLGIPCPKEYEIQGPQDIPDMIEYLGFPVVLKLSEHALDPTRPRLPFRVCLAHDEKQLAGYIDEYCADGNFPIFQEYVTGTVHNLCCFAAAGETVAVHQYHSVRRVYGWGVLRRVVECMPELERYSREMLRALKWDGLAHIGFFVSHDRKKTWYMETNGRVWGSVQGSVDAGWDFPYWLYRYFLHGEKPDPGPMRLGSQTCWHRGDLEALLLYLGGGEVPATGAHPGKLAACLQYLSGFNPTIHSDVFEWSDPLPEVIDHWRLFEFLLREGKRRLAGHLVSRRR